MTGNGPAENDSKRKDTSLFLYYFLKYVPIAHKVVIKINAYFKLKKEYSKGNNAQITVEFELLGDRGRD